MLEKLILVGSVAAAIAIGAFVVTRDFRRPANQVYGLMTLGMIVLLIANSLTTTQSATPLLFIRIVLAATTIVIASLYALIELIIFDSTRRRRTRGLTGLALITLIIAALDLTPFVFSGISVVGTQITPIAGPGAVLFLVHLVIVFAVSIITLLRHMIHDKTRKNLQYRSFLYAIVPIMIFAPITSFILPVIFHYSVLTAFTPLYVAYLVGMIAYAMVRHGLFDIKRAAVRTSAYVLVLVTLAALYYVVATIVSHVLLSGSYANIATSPLSIGLALLLAFLFQPLKTFFDRFTNSIFYRDHYSTEEFYGLLSNVLSATTDLKTLLQEASDAIAMTFKSGQAFFYIRYGATHHITAGTSSRTTLLVHEAKQLDALVDKQGPGIIETVTISRRREIFNMLSRKHIELLLPLWHDGAIMGYFALGDALGSRYTDRDIKVLGAIADELVIAIQNALSLEAVRDINENLQNRIDTATHSLLVSNDKLRRLDDTKDEFISMASHQLRTPLTSVKGYVSMILDGDAGPITPQQRKFLSEAFDSSNRMAGIIGDFLNVSRLQTGKFTLEREEINLADVVTSEIEHLENTASARGLVLKYHKPAHFPEMKLDKSKMQQVIMNFIDNALFYAPNTKTVDIELFQRAGRAVFTVRDHGIGVPKSEQRSLFTKFFRATNARRKRPDGTGVGLFLAKKVIVAHGGTIIFESEEGRGSTFGFELPLK